MAMNVGKVAASQSRILVPTISIASLMNSALMVYVPINVLILSVLDLASKENANLNVLQMQIVFLVGSANKEDALINVPGWLVQSEKNVEMVNVKTHRAVLILNVHQATLVLKGTALTDVQQLGVKQDMIASMDSALRGNVKIMKTVLHFKYATWTNALMLVL